MSLPDSRAHDQDGEPRRKLTVVADSGLCNRLKALSSGMAIAQATGRRFAMLWPTRSTGCPYDRLFQSEWNVRADAPVDERRLIDLRNHSWRSFPDLTQAQDDWLIIRHDDWLIQPARFPHHAALRERCAALIQELTPVTVLQERIDIFRSDSFRARMIGVHLRRGDFVEVRPDVVNNLAPSMESVDRWLDQAADAGILLCTDDGAGNPFSQRKIPYEGVIEQFARRYGARVVTNRPRTLDRRQPEATEDALVDLWLLRLTDWFVGTEGSSFSEMAGLGRAVTAVLVGAPTRRYQSQVRWLKRSGLYNVLLRVSRREYGSVVPYTLVLHRYNDYIKSYIRRITPGGQADWKRDGARGG